MFDLIDFAPLPYGDLIFRSPVLRRAGRGYKRMRAEKFHDAPADLTPRQAQFYRYLIDLALAVKSREIPVDFTTRDGRRMYLDRGCIKIAEHAGFIRPLRDNDAHGRVGTITLAWSVEKPAPRASRRVR